MEYSINIGRFVVNSLSNNANINFQSTYQNSHTANSSFIGGCFNYGDHSSLACVQSNQCKGNCLPDDPETNEGNSEKSV
ncbi:spore germination protein [Neobacillus sp. PS3-12]|uniref:spore germination protein n=1 Tax=Neobacillus sp. PS3-12 TaxID=3070677 RepID=UPI0035A8D9E2